MTRRLLLLSATALVGAATAGFALGGRAHPTALTGHDYVAYDAGQREAYLAGFVAGAAAQQHGERGANPSGKRVAAQVERAREAGTLVYLFAPNVYDASLSDYFFYQNRRGQTIIEAMVELNALKKRGGR